MVDFAGITRTLFDRIKRLYHSISFNFRMLPHTVRVSCIVAFGLCTLLILSSWSTEHLEPKLTSVCESYIVTQRGHLDGYVPKSVMNYV